MRVDTAPSREPILLGVTPTEEHTNSDGLVETSLLGQAARDAAVAITAILLRAALQRGTAPPSQTLIQPAATRGGQTPLGSDPAITKQRHLAVGD